MNKLLGALIYEIDEWFRYFFVDQCPGRIGTLVRRKYWQRRFKECGRVRIGVRCVISDPQYISLGNNINIMDGVRLYAELNGPISIGNNATINSNAYIDAHNGGEIVIGNNVAIGPNVILRASNHKTDQLDKLVRLQGHTGGKIEVEDDVWLAANVVVLPGVKIGKCSVVAAGAIVNRNIPENVLAGGVPVNIIKENYRKPGGDLKTE